jgi:DNA-3-methyladenine glycosylase
MLNKLLNQSADTVAKGLLGSYLIRNIDDQEIITRIVETEAYSQDDEASHSFTGITNRTEIMFGDPGFAYVYFTYGMHFCFNIVCQPKGEGAAVLIRAVEPISNIEQIRKHRPKIIKDIHLTNGPAKLTQALLIDKSLYGHNLNLKPLSLVLKPLKDKEVIVTAKRIGISKNKDKLRRFYIRGNPYVSVQ